MSIHICHGLIVLENQSIWSNQCNAVAWLQVGKQYVSFARLLQSEGSQWSLEMAQRALMRSWQILAGMKTRADPAEAASTAPCSLSDYGYLIGHLQQEQYSEAFTQMATSGALASPSMLAAALNSPMSGFGSALTEADTQALNQLQQLINGPVAQAAVGTGDGSRRNSVPSSPAAPP